MINAWSGGTPDAMPLFRPLAFDRRHRSFGSSRLCNPEVTGSIPVRSITSNADRHAGSRLEDGTPRGEPDAISTPEWSDLALRRARIASSSSLARCRYVAHLAQVGVAHEGVDLTTGKRPKMLMVVGNPTRRMNELYGAHGGDAVRDRGGRRPRNGRKSTVRRLQRGERSRDRCVRPRGTRDNCSEPRVGRTPSLCQSVGTRVVPDASLAGISRMHVIARVRHGRAWLWSGRKEKPSEHDS